MRIPRSTIISSRFRTHSLLCGAVWLFVGCGPAPLPEIAEPPAPTVREVSLEAVGLSAAALDRSVDPCADFYQFACGGWEKSTVIPADKPRWSRSFSEIHKRNITDLRSLLERAAAQPGGDLLLTKLGDFYGSCMDEARLEKAGVSGIASLWEAAASARALLPDAPRLTDEDGGKHDGNDGAKAATTASPAPAQPAAWFPLEQIVAQLHSQGVYVFFDVGSGQDFKDATKMIANVDQNGLGLPDRDYYLDDDQEKQDIRAFYLTYVARMLEMSGYEAQTARAAANDVLRIETDLARISKSRIERRDPKGMYNKIDRSGLRERTSGLQWDAYFTARKMDHVNDVSVTSVPYVEGLGAELSKLRQSELTHYLQFHVVHHFAEHLPKRFVQESFKLTAKLSGQAEQRPRWKRCIEATDGALGELLAQPYVAKRFSKESKLAVQNMVSKISDAFRAEVGGLPWMGHATRDEAIAKLDKMAYLIGYPDKWKTYGFSVDRASHTRNVLSAHAFDIARNLSKIGKPVDRGEWFMTPPTVNAYYSPLKNQMVFPAGILQPPFFDPKASIAVNLGGMGMVVGHELTHGFDDQGSQFDGDGNLSNWWKPSTRAGFKKRTACMVSQYDSYEVLPGVRLNGKLTLGENIADAGGVKLALSAYRNMRENAQEVVVAEGFTEDQQFFLSIGQIWCSKYRPKFAKLRATTDYHAQPNWRVNGALANTPAFAEVFQCTEGSPMKPVDACNVW